jgi:hypothetical protein
MSNERTLFEPEVILPVQISWATRRGGNTSGACSLMVAILEDAKLCIERGRRRRHWRTRAQAAEAETWMRSDCREWLFSFASICDVLGFDADDLRARLLADAEPSASGGRAAHPEAQRPSPRGAPGARPLPQREDTRGSIGFHTARAPARGPNGGRGAGAGFRVRADLPDQHHQRESRPVASAECVDRATGVSG